MLGHDRDDFLRAGHEAAIGLWPGIMTLEGVAYTVARSAIDRVLKTESGGFEPDTSVGVRLLVGEIEGDPPLHALVDLDGQTLRIERVQRDAGGVTWYLELSEA